MLPRIVRSGCLAIEGGSKSIPFSYWFRSYFGNRSTGGHKRGRRDRFHAYQRHVVTLHQLWRLQLDGYFRADRFDSKRIPKLGRSRPLAVERIVARDEMITAS